MRNSLRRLWLGAMAGTLLICPQPVVAENRTNDTIQYSAPFTVPFRDGNYITKIMVGDSLVWFGTNNGVLY